MAVGSRIDRRRFLANAVMTISAVRLGVAGCASAESPATIRLPSEGGLQPLSGATEWLNSPPLMAHSPRGSVVLVNFWTFSCINSIRVLPYLRAWDAKYKKQGLVVVGVVALEFEFEKSIDNVRWAVKDRMGA